MEKNRAYNILKRLTDRTVPSEYRSVIRGWLTDATDPAEKEIAMRRIWLETRANADDTTRQSLQQTLQKYSRQIPAPSEYPCNTVYYVMPQFLSCRYLSEQAPGG